jgi:glycosyltransferase involved in cell wall biosynthesis
MVDDAMTLTLSAPSMNVPLKKAKISVIVPAYNEEEKIDNTLEKIVDVLDGLTDSGEVIIVDDGSQDYTYNRLKEFKAKSEKIRLKLVRNGTNIGKGFAVKHGAELATADIIAIIDADMEINPYQIKRYLKKLETYDLCIASKRHPNSIYHAPPLRKIQSWAFNVVTRLATGLKCTDTQTGLKIIRADAFRKIMNVIVVKRHAYDVEILLAAKLLNLKVAELPVRVETQEKFNLLSIFNMLTDLMGITYRLRVTKFYQKALMQAGIIQ